MTLLIDLHHTHVFDTFLDATRAALIPGTLLTLNLPIKDIIHQGSSVFGDVILVSNYLSMQVIIGIGVKLLSVKRKIQIAAYAD